MSSNKPEFVLEAVGIQGPNFLKHALTNCTDPLKAIEQFQVTNGILLPSLRPMLPLLDLHGVRRLDFHMSVVEELREKMVSHINEIGKTEGEKRDQKLKELLVKTFPVIKVKALRPIVMAILKNTPQIEDQYLKVLVRDRDLYNDADTEVKRQIWKDNQSLFGDEVSPLFSQYISEKENILFDHSNTSVQFFGPTPKNRRQGEVVQKLAHMIGNSVKLYDMVLQFLRTLFLRTRNVHYCTLRAELLMALHDMDIQEIVKVDPCHKFTWCLDACVREKAIDTKRSKELQGFMDNVKRGQEQVLGDLSMTLCDPYAVNFLATTAIKIFQHLIHNEGFPRDNPVLILILRMLSLGLSAWQMIDSQEFKEPKLDLQIVTKFVPALMSLMVDDQVRNLSSKLPPDEREAAITVIEHAGPLPDAVEAYLQDSSVASILAMYYTLHVAKSKDRVALLRILQVLANCKDDKAFDDPFLHSLVSLLIHNMEEFQAEDFCTALFDEFFFAGLSRDNVNRHVLKLLWYVHHKLPINRLDTLLKALQPTHQHSEKVHALFKLLKEKITTTEEPPPQEIDIDLNSPLMSVPTPAPYHI